jgi:hypothetical protein
LFNYEKFIILLLGIRIETIPAGIYHEKQLDSEWEESCEEFVNDSFIGTIFDKSRYVTMMAEDCARGVYNWPECRGFETKPTTHYMR